MFVSTEKGIGMRFRRNKEERVKSVKKINGFELYIYFLESANLKEPNRIYDL